MAAGTLAILTIDSTPLALRGWQLLKAPITAAETALTATKLLDDMRLVVPADDNSMKVIPVLDFDMIQVMVIANGTADQSPVLDFYGWPETGPGHHIGTLTTDISTAAMTVASASFLASSRTHISIRDAFAAATAWKIVDQYVVTLDAEQERLQDTTATPLQQQSFRALNVPGVSAIGGAIGTSSTEANFPQVFNVDFTHSYYSFFGMVPTSLDSATSVGAIFRVVKMRERL
jgi:hypothetical protein